MTWEKPKTNWKAGDAPTKDDFNRVEGNIDIIGKYDRASGYANTIGTNDYTITLNPKPTSLYEGLGVSVKVNNQNTGASTLNINNLGPKSIKKANGRNVSEGNLKAGSIYTLKYNGANFILQGEGGEYGNALASDVIKGRTIGTEGGIVTGTMVDRGTVNQTLITQGGQYTIPGGKHSGSGKVTVNINNLVPSNIPKDVNVGGVVGSYDEIPAWKIATEGTLALSADKGHRDYEYIFYPSIIANSHEVYLEVSSSGRGQVEYGAISPYIGRQVVWDYNMGSYIEVRLFNDNATITLEAIDYNTSLKGTYSLKYR